MSLFEKALRKFRERSAVTASAPTGAPAHQLIGPARAEAKRFSRARNASRGGSSPAPIDGAPLSVNFSLLRAAGLLPAEADVTRLAQQYRRISQRLIGAAIGRGGPRLGNGRLILVASAMPGEGKTFTAINLALSMSLEKDVHVLMVDADVTKRQISRLLGVDKARGLLDLLRDPELGVEQVVRLTSVPRLSILPAGALREDTSALFASPRMAQVANVLGHQDPCRIVLVDSPPLRQMTGAHMLARVAGHVLVVVRAEFTPQPTVLDALKLLEGHPGVSLVLDQSRRFATTAPDSCGCDTGQSITTNADLT